VARCVCAKRARFRPAARAGFYLIELASSSIPGPTNPTTVAALRRRACWPRSYRKSWGPACKIRRIQSSFQAECHQWGAGLTSKPRPVRRPRRELEAYRRQPAQHASGDGSHPLRLRRVGAAWAFFCGSRRRWSRHRSRQRHHPPRPGRYPEIGDHAAARFPIIDLAGGAAGSVPL